MDTAIDLAIGVVKEIAAAVEGDSVNNENALVLRNTSKLIGENLGKIRHDDQQQITHLEELMTVLQSTKEYCQEFSTMNNTTWGNFWRKVKHRKHDSRFKKLKEDLDKQYDHFSKGLQVEDHNLLKEINNKLMAVIMARAGAPDQQQLQQGGERPAWFVERKDFIDTMQENVLNTIGQGSFGEVIKGKIQGRTVALKKVYLSDKRAFESFKSEVSTTIQLCHANLVQSFGGYFEFNHVQGTGQGILIMELLRPLVLSELDDDARLQHTSEVSDALAYMHSNRVSHRDIKPDNIMLDDKGRTKLIDLGLSKERDASAQSTLMTGAGQGTPPYMAPEIHAPGGMGGTSSVDTYAFAVLTFEMWTGRRPFDGKTPDQIKALVIKGDRPKPLPSLKYDMDSLVRECWQDNMHKRPKMEEVSLRLMMVRKGLSRSVKVETAGATGEPPKSEILLELESQLQIEEAKPEEELDFDRLDSLLAQIEEQKGDDQELCGVQAAFDQAMKQRDFAASRKLRPKLKNLKDRHAMKLKKVEDANAGSSSATPKVCPPSLPAAPPVEDQVFLPILLSGRW